MTTTPAQELPTLRTRPSPWFALCVVPIVVIRIVTAIVEPSPGNLGILTLVLLWSAVVALTFLDGQPFSTTFDGEVVESRGRFSRTRFRLDDIVWVIDAVFARTAPVKVRRVERRFAGLRIPHPWPWRPTVGTSVAPSFWVRQLGVPENKVRGGGPTWRRRGLR